MRENDLNVMEAFVNEGFSGVHQQHINRCRLYLQVTTLSDILNEYTMKMTMKN